MTTTCLNTTLALLASTSSLCGHEYWQMDSFPEILSSVDGWNIVQDALEADLWVYDYDDDLFTTMADDHLGGGWWYMEMFPFTYSYADGWLYVFTEDNRIFVTNTETGELRALGDAGEMSPFAGSYTITSAEYGTVVTVIVEDGVRRIISNGLPNHTHGEGAVRVNRNMIAAQDFDFSFPVNPVENAEPTPYNVPQNFGIAVNGVVIEPNAAEWYNDDRNSGWQEVALVTLGMGMDIHHGHIQPGGTYHYHATPTGILDDALQPQLLGWAGDGFPIYGTVGYVDAMDATSGFHELTSSYQLKSGTRPSGPGGVYDGTYQEDYEYVAGSGDLDECNGRYGVTPEYPEGTYYYVISEAWPFFGRAFRGELVESFVSAGPGGPR